MLNNQTNVTMKVNHAKFGQGQVISQDENNVTVDFNGAVKTLVIKFSRLTNEDGTPFGETFVAPKKKNKKLNKANFMSNEEYAKSDVAKMSNDDFEAKREIAKRSSHSNFY